MSLTSRIPLSELPPELVVEVLRFLPDFTSLLCAVQTCHTIKSLYINNSCRVLCDIFLAQRDRISDHNVVSLFWELIFAIQHTFISRDDTEQLFTIGWRVFRQIQLEELLLPLARELARSYIRVDRKKDAIKLLQKLIRGIKPFDYAPKSRTTSSVNGLILISPTLAPLGKLLRQLVQPYQKAFLSTRTNPLQQSIRVVRVTREEIHFSLPRKAKLLMSKSVIGIKFTQNTALVGLANPPPISFTNAEQYPLPIRHMPRSPLTDFHRLRYAAAERLNSRYFNEARDLIRNPPYLQHPIMNQPQADAVAETVAKLMRDAHAALANGQNGQNGQDGRPGRDSQPT